MKQENNDWKTYDESCVDKDEDNDDEIVDEAAVAGGEEDGGDGAAGDAAVKARWPGLKDSLLWRNTGRIYYFFYSGKFYF